MAASEPRGPQVMQHPGPEKELCDQIMPQNAHASQGVASFGFDPSAPDYRGALEQARADFLSKCRAGKEVAPATEEQGPAPATKTFTPRSAADLLSAPQAPDAVKGIFPSEGRAVIYGPSGSAKSFLELDLAAAIVEGRPWFGFRTRQHPVTIINLEGALNLRLAAWQKERGREFPSGVQFITEPFSLLEDFDSLARVVPRGSVIFVDTLNASCPGMDENSSKDMGLALEAAKTLQRLTGGLVVLVHHSGKDASRGMRGHSSLYAAMDAVLEVGRSGDSRFWRLAKSKNGPDGIRRGFFLKSVPLGRDEDGDPVSSCTVTPDSVPVQGDERSLKPSLKYALETLEAVLKRYKRYTVTLEQWREEFYAHHTADSSNAKKVAFRRARMELQAIGQLSVINDEYGIVGRTEGEAVPVHAGTLPVQQQNLYRTQTHDGTGTDGTHLFRGVPLVPPSDGLSYE